MTRIFTIVAFSFGALCVLAPVSLADDDARAAAKAVVSDFTADHPLALPAFSDGLRVTGITIEPDAGDLQRSRDSEITLEFSPPASFERDRLLAVIEPGAAVTARLLWERVAPVADTATGYSIHLAHQKGYPRFDAKNQLQRPGINGDAVGATGWTTHPLDQTNSSYPGVFNVFVSAEVGEPTPLGQIFMLGVVDRRPDIHKQMLSLYDGEAILFAGHLALSPWYTAHIPLGAVDIGDYTLDIVSSADWVANYGDNTAIAEVIVTRRDGSQDKYRLLLGRDTAQTQYPTQNTNQIRHKRAPVAWRWKVEDNDVDVEAYVYRASFTLKASVSPPVSVAIRRTLDEGVLRVRGVALRR